ncbi:MAG TPA: SDR family oxidoreductase [Acidobacteriaceae bacterium]|jgi:nucleoside-diphosphate-sugar epimerase|nr:SDR family oxidoreductase [Acidobacteriaceae bacterium]
MRVFVTGATGFIGSRVVPELIAAGHSVLGLTRSEAGAAALTAAGAQPHRGDIYDLESIRSGAAQADAVIHLAFNHDFSKFQENCETDRRVIETLGATVRPGQPLLVTSGTGMGSAQPGQLITENDPPLSSKIVARAASEEAALAAASRGVRVGIVRLPQVHDTVKQGLVTYAIQIARAKGVAAYIGEGRNRWPAAHVTDVAHLYRLALEKAADRAIWHAVAEEGVPVRTMAEAIGRGLNIPAVSITPEEAPAYFGWLASFAGWDIAASSAQTRAQLGWNPAGPNLITDLNHMDYTPL